MSNASGSGRDALICAYVRTPIGRYAGALAGLRPDAMAAGVLRAIVERSGVDPAGIDDVILGNANGAGEDNTTSPGWPRCSPGSPLRCRRRP